jgi:cytochrome P450/NADPH-cytochrome P450 reductase
MLSRNVSLKFNSDLVKPKFKLTFETGDSTAHPIGLEYTGATFAEVIQNTKITSDPNHQVFVMELRNSSNLYFEPGDEISVWPTNSRALVDQLISRLGFPPQALFRLEQEGSFREPLPWSSAPTHLRHALKNFYDINHVSPSLLKFFALHAKNPNSQKELVDFAEASNEKFMRCNLNIADVLELYPDVQLPNDAETLAIFLGLLKPMRPRTYSISSSPSSSKDIIRITYRLVTYRNSLVSVDCINVHWIVFNLKHFLHKLDCIQIELNNILEETERRCGIFILSQQKHR